MVPRVDILPKNRGNDFWTSTAACGSLCFALLSEVLIKPRCCSHGHLAKNFLLIRDIFIHCLFLGMLRWQAPSSRFSAQGILPGTSPSAEGRAWLSVPAESCPGHQHSLVPGCQHRSPEMPEPAAQGTTGGLLWQNWDAGMDPADQMPRRQQGSHNTG